MFASLIEPAGFAFKDGTLLRSSFHNTLEEAKNTGLGVVAVEKIGKGIIWRREENEHGS